ncbi:MAG: hypothetical protein IKI33_01725, partial [Eubacterium sp.]|nr:hypothetical protein [Eubacterium sp.]
FKNYLTKDFNHTFRNLHSIICWDISSNIKNGSELEDITGTKRTLKIVQPAEEGDYTRYYLDDLRSERKIEIFALKQYLKEKFDIDFKPRNDKSTF